MRLTSLGRALSVALAVVAGASAAYGARGTITALFARSTLQSPVEVAAIKRSLVYRLDPARPLEFALSRPSNLIRIVAEPLVSEASWHRRDYWTYGYAARLYDAAGTLVDTREVYSRALHPDRILPFRRPVRFMRDTPARIALQDDVVIESAVPVSRVALVPLPSDDSVEGIDLRVYERLPFIGRAATAAFLRRSPAEQAAMASAGALPAELLGDEARGALMTNRWKVLGPLGVPGEDYGVYVLYEGRYRDVVADEEEEE